MSMARSIFAIIFAGVWLSSVVLALAQNTPAPGPTNPTPPNPQAQPGATMVINPTEQECRRGWNPSLKWTKEQFEEFCTRLGASR
jgi:hypothetical protein